MERDSAGAGGGEYKNWCEAIDKMYFFFALIASINYPSDTFIKCIGKRHLFSCRAVALVCGL